MTHSSNPPGISPSREATRGPLPSRARSRCLITTLDPKRGLSRALLGHLASELRGIELTVDPRGHLDSIWLCGYERGSADVVRDLRAQHPGAVILVTGRGIEWRREVLEAGADRAATWPVNFELVRESLSAAPKRGSRSARAV